MAKKRKSAQKNRPKKPSPGRSVDKITVCRLADGKTYELVHPPCVHQRAADIEEVHAMLHAGEIDVAAAELRWLLEGCHALLKAHKLLAEIAISEEDLPLARAHFEYAYELGQKSLPKGGLDGVLPYDRPANRAFFEAGKGLARCLSQLGESESAAKLVKQLLALDPRDPLAVKDLLKEA